jgi:hypothetical protein
LKAKTKKKTYLVSAVCIEHEVAADTEGIKKTNIKQVKMLPLSMSNTPFAGAGYLLTEIVS